MIEREILTNKVVTALGRSRAAVLIGPRQCGKTTLARLVAQEREAVAIAGKRV